MLFRAHTRNRRLGLGIMVAGVLGLLVSGSVQAATSMYVVGKLTIPSFANDTTTGLSAPFYSTNYLGVPFGQHCNSAHGTGTTVCYATSYYQSAHDGSPLVGTGHFSVGSSASGAINLPQSLLSVKLGSVPTVFTTTDFAKKPQNGVPGGSFSYYPPYIYSYTYADLKNAAGNFFAGGGPGTQAFYATAGGAAAGSMFTTKGPGAGKFGGTMSLLGVFQTHFAYAISGGFTIGTDDWLVDWQGAGTVAPGGTLGVQTKTSTGTNKHNVLLVTNTVYITASAFPWTTGYATVNATRGPFYTKFARTGYNNRTAGGAGNIQMVSPMLTHWKTPAAGLDYETGSIGVMTLKFTPEPSSAMLLVAGVSLLGLVYRNNRGA